MISALRAGIVVYEEPLREYATTARPPEKVVAPIPVTTTGSVREKPAGHVIIGFDNPERGVKGCIKESNPHWLRYEFCDR